MNRHYVLPAMSGLPASLGGEKTINQTNMIDTAEAEGRHRAKQTEEYKGITSTKVCKSPRDKCIMQSIRMHRLHAKEGTPSRVQMKQAIHSNGDTKDLCYYKEKR